jgi:hypothetical protein
MPQQVSSATSGSAGKLEALLQEQGSEETQAAWVGGLAGVHSRLDGCKKLSRPLRLGLVIKVLKAGTCPATRLTRLVRGPAVADLLGWIKDGTWPTDPKTQRAAKPPSSPSLSAHKLSQNSQRIAQLPPSSSAGRPATPMPALDDIPLAPTPPVPDLIPDRSTPLTPTKPQSRAKLDSNASGDVWRGDKRGAEANGNTPTGDHG